MSSSEIRAEINRLIDSLPEHLLPQALDYVRHLNQEKLKKASEV